MYFKKIDFSKYSSLKIGSTLDVAVIEDECDAIDGFLVGGAYNLLISNNPPPLAILGDAFDFIRLENDSLFVGAATMSGRVYSFAKKNDLSGFEFLSHLPGTIGGLVAMNAGLKEYEIFSVLKRIRFKDGWAHANEIEYGYRRAKLPSAVFEVEFDAKKGFDALMIEIFRKMRENQPKEPSAGSFFKNPPNDYAGRLIEVVGLKGHKIGAAAFSERHANFLVNLGGATFEDAMALVKLAKTRVFENFGVTLEEEVKILYQTT